MQKDFGNLKELNTGSDIIVSKLLESDKITNLLYYNTMDALDLPVLSSSERKDLLYKNIYPYKVMNKLSEDALTYLMFNFRNIRTARTNDEFKTMNIVFYVLCHPNYIRITGGLRYYSIMEELDQLFNSKRIIGIGKTEIDMADELVTSDLYSGYYVSYRITEFNS